MKTVVFAYHNIGCEGIRALLDSGFEIAAVFTHKDNPNENVWFDSVAELAASKGIPVYAPDDVNHAVWVNRIREMAPDIIFSFYYRDMLKEEILDLPYHGCLNLHGSLLPKYRGRCPINWVLVNGESETGVSLHYMVKSADAGDIVAQQRVPIADDDTALTLHRKAAVATGELLRETLPLIRQGEAARTPQVKSEATYFGGRKPADGQIDWTRSAREVRNLVRAVTKPYPGAFSHNGARKYLFWSVTETPSPDQSARPGLILSTQPLVVACGDGALRIDSAQEENGVPMTGTQLADEHNLVEGAYFGPNAAQTAQTQRKTSVLILGVNGFIGNALTERLLADGNYTVHGMDLRSTHVQRFIGNPDFHFEECDISIHREWLEYHIRKCDVIIPLIAIATPIEYTRNPLRVFELDFEENLRVVRYCVKYNKRILFPSTSEVYGMCEDSEFDEEDSKLITGPIRMQRWIYSCSKQLLDRVIWAYGQKNGLRFTLFRPFNWIGPRLDSLNSARIGSSRAITQMILNLVEGTPILLIDGGEQKRCFTDVSEGIECLFRIIENKGGVCNGKIFNIGNPENEASIKRQAELLVKHFEQHPLRDKFPPLAGMRVVDSGSYYGAGYQDVKFRRPSIRNARRTLGWKPVIGLEESVKNTLDFFLNDAVSSGDFFLE